MTGIGRHVDAKPARKLAAEDMLSKLPMPIATEGL